VFYSNRKRFEKTESVFNLLGIFVENTFGRTLIFSKMSFSNIGDFKKKWKRVRKTIFLVRV